MQSFIGYLSVKISKLEFFILILLGYLIFEVAFIRIGFLLGSPIKNFTIVLSFIMYSAILTFLFSIINLSAGEKKAGYISLSLFFIASIVLFGFSVLLSNTFDTSWDGQGYHQTGVIALAEGWNPIRNPSINLKQELPSQIFAEGYPSALWEIEASIYALTGRINSAKIMNFLVGMIAYAMIYVLLRKMTIDKLESSLISFFLVFQPVYILQLFTFMQDGFGYELLLIAASSLIISIISPKSYWAISVFLFTEILLVSTKYSHLPVALILGFIFALVAANSFLNKVYVFNKNTKLFLAVFIILSIIFAYLPYIRNSLTHRAAFYPTNIPELMGSVKYNNVPLNLSNSDKFSLLFYGIFSRAQSSQSGDPTNKKNVARLKVPFTFSLNEIKDSASLYNNRVGAGGPLFSGIVVASVAFLIFISFKAKDKKERYTIYASYFCVAVILLLSLLAPTPNLLRYVNQLQIIPFAILVPLYAVFKKSYIQIFTLIVLMLVSVNTLLYSTAVVQRNLTDADQINKQLTYMRNSGKTYEVRAQQFYSSYIILTEQHIPFTIVDRLRCNLVDNLAATSITTQFCARSV